MNPFVVGQRWVSETEPELGLGTVWAVETRRVTVRFEESDCTRQYSAAAAPLRRVTFKPGDAVTSRNKASFSVDTVEEVEGILVYCGNGHELPESELSDTLSFSSPVDRLAGGFADASALFDLRAEALSQHLKAKASPVRGFLGGRVDLIGHQFHIAREVSERRLPRVLLADEVGLGKTIEACLILHRLLLTEQVSRVLILVPDALVHQWFVELLRRFNLHFRIANAEHLAEAAQRDPAGNPFTDDQLILAPLATLKTEKHMLNALTAGFDMVVVDEAHHMEPEGHSFQCVEALARASRGLLLLTATPEQMGQKAHFAQLRLLDPARYPGFEAYKREADGHRKVAALAEKLLDNKALTLPEQNTLSTLTKAPGSDRLAMVEDLLDRHGPGRVIFRNTRKSIKGFAGRVPNLCSLDATAGAIALHHEELRHEQDQDAPMPDLADDPRIHWLARHIKAHRHEKILVICTTRQKARAIESALARHLSVKIALFHEEMPLIRRDRNAAWFAEKDGARLLICSEIGSEGRNFQFARHLVLFDLPTNPEKVEQRIGRLDRIGQEHDITIHVPFLAQSATEISARWYEAMGLFSRCVPGLHAIGATLKAPLDGLMDQAMETGHVPVPELDELLAETRRVTADLAATLEKGRDRLLELSANRPERIKALLAMVNAQDSAPELPGFILRLFRHHGIEVDMADGKTVLLEFKESDEPSLPLPPFRRNPLVVTFDRNTALKREEIEFLTADHPMVVGALESFLGSDTGNAALACLPGAEENGLLVELLGVPECVAPARLRVDRFLPTAPFRMVLNHAGEEVTDRWSSGDLSEALEDLPTPWLSEHPSLVRELLPGIMKQGTAEMDAQSRALTDTATVAMAAFMDREISRLTALKATNPDVTDAELTALVTEKRAMETALGGCRIRLDSLRLILLMP
ncbi:RNA polymerase-associated protein RapA [Desulfoluna spongiiphila]|uniref:RNA polymerase-associated protein RapA n=1 Tax=Desulfoluna spongiiphila TaxID=419481 RepID=UPI001259B5E6|nr:RNA polymerase-associated protein RapA [Desulfoluna spongiiphila]VVS94768.1 rna polymerase-associated protein rapa [Desulfoluna spongiiphila]